MKKTYVVNIYSIERKGELIHTITDAVEVLKIISEITDKVKYQIDTAKNRTFVYNEQQYVVEILR